MKKRVLALVCVLTVCMTLLSGTGWAAEADAPSQQVIVGGVELDGSGAAVYALTDSTGTVTTEGAGATNWNIKLENGVLTLQDAYITQGVSFDGGSAGIYGEGSLEIVLMGKNAVGGQGLNAGIYVLNSLLLGGEGSLDVAVSGGDDCYGIYAYNCLTITGGLVNVEATATGQGNSYGIYNYADELMISGGSVNAAASAQSGNSYGVCTDYEMYLAGDGSLVATAVSDSGSSRGLVCLYNLAVLGNEASLTAQGETMGLDGVLFVNTFEYYDLDSNQTIQISNGQVTIDQENVSMMDANQLWVNGVQIYGGTESASVPGVSYDPDTNTLTLDGAVITEEYSYTEGYNAGIWARGNLNLELIGHNTISGDSINEGVSVIGHLNISGNGTLDVSISADGNNNAIYAGYCIIEDGTLNLSAASHTDSNGLLAEYSLTVNGGTINATATGEEYCYGLYTFDDLTINGGTINVTADSTVGNSVGIACFNNMVVNGGTVKASASNGNQDSLGIFLRGGILTVNGGTVTAKGDCLALSLTTNYDPAYFATALAISDLALDNPTITIGESGHLYLNGGCSAQINSEQPTAFSALAYNQGSLTVRVDALAQAQSYLAWGGAITLELAGGLAGDLSVPAGARLVIDGGGMYGIKGAVTCQTTDGTVTSLTLKDLALDGGGEQAHAVYAVSENGAGTLTLTMEDCTVSGYTGRAIELSAAGDSSFNGITERDWFYDSMCYVWERGLMESQAVPSAPITRSALVTALWRLAGQPVVNFAMNFEDVSGDAPYAEAVRWAASEQLLDSGTSSFGPEAPITREEIAILLYRYAQARGCDVSVGENTNLLSYADAADVSERAMAAMQWACGAGIIQGTGDGSLLNPLGSGTCAEAATMLMQLSRNLAA